MNINFGRRRSAFIISALVAASLPFAVSSHKVRGAELQPIHVTTTSSFTAGATLPVEVDLEGAASTTVYSDPPNAVAWNGYIDGTSAVVPATTDPNASGPVSVYAITDGETVVTTEVEAQQVSGGGMPAPGCIASQAASRR